MHNSQVKFEPIAQYFYDLLPQNIQKCEKNLANKERKKMH